MAAAKGATITVKGVVTGITANSVYFQDLSNVGGYLLFGTSSGLPAGIVNGAVIVVTGKIDIYNGVRELTNATEVKVVGTAEVEPVNITSLFTAGTTLSDTKLTNMQGALVTVDGAVLSSISGDNGNLTVNGISLLLYFGGKNQVTAVDLNGVKGVFSNNVGKSATVTGYVSIYNDAIQLIPAVDAIDVDENGASTLPIPVVDVDDKTGLASWYVENAVAYVIEINGTALPQTADNTTVTYQLNDGDTIRVKAIGDGVNYNDSPDWSAAVTYHKVDVVFDFSSIKSSNGTSATATHFTNACGNGENFVGASSFTNAYAEGGSIRLGSSNNTGSFTLTFSKKVASVIINCALYNNDTGSTLTVTGATGGAQTVQSAKTNLTFTLNVPTETIVITSGTKRCNIYKISVIFAEETTTLDEKELGLDISKDGKATWNDLSGKGATKYVYTLNEDLTEYEVAVGGTLEVQLQDGDTIHLKAIGDGETVLDSKVVSKNYDRDELDDPTLKYDEYGNVTLTGVSDAEGYAYTIDKAPDTAQEEDIHKITTAEELNVKLNDGQTIYVWAVGDGKFYNNSSVVHWTYHKEEKEQDTLPTLYLEQSSGQVYVTEKIEYATKLIYQIKTGEGTWGNDNEIAVSDSTNYALEIYKLSYGQSIRVRAYGDEIYIFPDGTEDTHWASVDYVKPADPVPVKAPTVTVDRDGTVRVSHSNTLVTSYKYYFGTDLTEEKLSDVSWQDLNGSLNFNSDGEGSNSLAVIACKYNEDTADSKATIVKYKAPAGSYDDFDPDENELAFEEADVKGGKPQVRISFMYPGEDGTKIEIEFVTNDGSTKETVILNDLEGEITVELKAYTAITIKALAFTTEVTAPNFDYSSWWDESGVVSIFDKYNEYYDSALISIVTAEKNALTKPENGDTLPVKGATYTDVEIGWEITEGNADYAKIDGEGKLVLDETKLTAESATIHLVATLSYSGKTDNVTFPYELKKPAQTTTSILKSNGSKTNMSTTGNNASSVNLDADVFEVKSSGGNQAVGLYAPELRVYQNNTLTVIAQGGVQIISIKITVESGTVNKVTNGTDTVTGTNQEYIINSTTFTVLNSDSTQLKITQIEITHTEPNFSDEDKVDMAIAQLEQTDGISGTHNSDFSVDTTGKFGLAITWNESKVSGDGSLTIDKSTGAVTVVRGEKEDTVYNLTASVTSGSVTKSTKAFQVTIQKQPAGGTVTFPVVFSFETYDNFVTSSATTQKWESTELGVTFTNNKASSQNDVVKYSPVRCYAGSTIIVECEFQFKTVVFACDSTSNTLAGTISGGSISTSSTTSTLTLNAPATSFTITNLTKQARIKTMTFTA